MQFFCGIRKQIDTTWRTTSALLYFTAGKKMLLKKVDQITFSCPQSTPMLASKAIQKQVSLQAFSADANHFMQPFIENFQIQSSPRKKGKF